MAAYLHGADCDPTGVVQVAALLPRVADAASLPPITASDVVVGALVEPKIWNVPAALPVFVKTKVSLIVCPGA